MASARKPVSKAQAGAARADTEQLFFMLNCYDVWSATPRHGCDADEAAGAADKPAEAAAA